MTAIWQTVIQTPWWVYLLLGYLIAVGIISSKTRIIPFWKVFVLPAIFLVMSIQTLATTETIEYLSVGSWLAAMLTGGLFSWRQAKLLAVKVDKKHSLIQIPGSWNTLLVIGIIFAAKYYFGYEQAVNPVLAAQPSFKLSMLLLSGVCTGLFIGRLIYYLNCYKKDLEVDLT